MLPLHGEEHARSDPRRLGRSAAFRRGTSPCLIGHSLLPCAGESRPLHRCFYFGQGETPPDRNLLYLTCVSELGEQIQYHVVAGVFLANLRRESPPRGDVPYTLQILEESVPGQTSRLADFEFRVASSLNNLVDLYSPMNLYSYREAIYYANAPTHVFTYSCQVGYANAPTSRFTESRYRPSVSCMHVQTSLISCRPFLIEFHPWGTMFYRSAICTGSCLVELLFDSMGAY